MYSRFLYHYFWFVRRMTYRVREKFTLPGQMVLAAIVATAVLGVDTNRTMAFQAFTFLLALMVFALVQSRFFKIEFKADRELPKFGTAGEPLSYKVKIQNSGRKKQTGLYLIENINDSRASFLELQNQKQPHGIVGMYRWLWKESGWRGEKSKNHPLPVLGGHGQAEVRMTLTPPARGRLSLEKLVIVRPDPLNLVNSFYDIPGRQTIFVLPKRYSLPPINLPGVRKHQPGGFALAHSVGDSEEFLSMRDYRPGDPLRRIHWKSWAKTGKPIVKEFQEEFFVRHALILDTFSDGQSRRVFEEAVSVAASFASSIQTRESLLDLMFVGNKAYCFTTGRGLAHKDMMLEVLASVTPCTDKPFSTLAPVVLPRAPLLSGCVCVFLCWDKARKDFINQLKALGIPAMALVIVDSREPDKPEPEEGGPEFKQLMTDHIARGLEGL